ncbi:MAG TPA: S8 family serine peptidase [Thermoanaerobaculia bacterium]|jgi:subtilisin family serine protease|nr:S8 family serine peptidase [Thermoanaerobaculia bacterium]
MPPSKKTPRSRSQASTTGGQIGTPPPAGPPGPSLAAEPEGNLTGRYIVTFRAGAQNQAMSLMSRSAGIGLVASAADFEAGAVDLEQTQGAGAVYFDQLGVAVVSTPPDQLNALAAAVAEDDESAILAVEPERIMEAIHEDPLAYLRGYRDAVVHLYEQLSGEGGSSAEQAAAAAALADTDTATWGISATRVLTTRFTGRGIRVAVLDTGMDLGHPDFAGRSVTSQTFVPGEAVQDRHGHGTHCIGTACGPARPIEGRRYGIASEAQIFAGKVLANNGKGADTSILAGINWAVANGCHVISMSLGVQAPPSVAYEQAAQRALAAGCLIVAAAGNDSRRSQNLIRPVSRAANCVSILSVAAVDSRFRVAEFSNHGTSAAGGQVDIAGPGVDVFSCAPMPLRNKILSGTSMATPHVAGIAALWAEARQVTGAALFQVVSSAARRLGALSVDVGAGLVQAP